MLPFILPFFLYLFLSQFAGNFPAYYPLFYSISVVLVGSATFFLLRHQNIVRIHKTIWPGILFGVVGIVMWIFLSRLHLEQSVINLLPEWLAPSERPSFNPFHSIDTPMGQWGFIAIRLFGLAVLVPIVEEIFWRGFLLRWVISPDWQDQEIGIFSWKSFLWVTLLFTLAHPEWLAAALYCSLLNILLYWRRDLWNCIIAHATSNLILGVYVIYTRSWELQ